MNKLSIGDSAEKFILNNHKGEQINSDELKGKQILLSFFPVAFTPV